VFDHFVDLSSTWNLMFDHFVDLASTQNLMFMCGFRRFKINSTQEDRSVKHFVWRLSWIES
jgi:hypothetical protein